MLFSRIEKVVLKKVTKFYGNLAAVDGVSLEVYGGELLALIGPSGSGKTTLLRMINRLVEPDSGEVYINDRNVKEFDVVELRRSIGYVIQQIGLFPHMRVKENVALLMKLEGWSGERIEKRIKELMDLVSLPYELLERYPHQLSGGQQQRVGLARAIALNPPLLLMDEPFGALDPILRRQLQEEFLKIKSALGRTIVFVTHDIEEAFKLGDRIGIMRSGKLIQLGYPEELVLNPVNEFVGRLVDSSRKFKHLDNLKVEHMMIPADKYIIEVSKDAKRLLEFMESRNIEYAVLTKNNIFSGVVELKDLIVAKSVDEAVKEPLIFSPSDSLEGALMEMKARREFSGVVVDGNKPVGVLLSNEILSRLL